MRATSAARARPPPPGMHAACARGSFIDSNASAPIEIAGTRSGRPNTAASSARASGESPGCAPRARTGTTGPPTSGARIAGTPAGAVTRSCTTSTKGRPVSASINSAITQWAEIGWYSVWAPGCQSSVHSANWARRPALVPHERGPIGACGKPPCMVSSCSTVTSSLPFVPNSGTYSATRRVSSSEPSARCATSAIATMVLVALKMTKRWSSVAAPNVRDATISPSRAIAYWAADDRSASISSWTKRSSWVTASPSTVVGMAPYSRGP